MFHLQPFNTFNMADFEKFYPLLAPHEGGYLSAKMAEEKDDKGGETYRGIARNFNRDWEGWKIIDAYKAKYGIPKWNSIIPDAKLNNLVKERSRKNYWDAHNFGQIKNQSVANALADFTFNSGPGNAVVLVQRLLGLKADGVAGKMTLEAINKANQKWLLDKITEGRVALIRASKSINPDFKPQLVERAESFFFIEEEGQQ